MTQTTHLSRLGQICVFVGLVVVGSSKLLRVAVLGQVTVGFIAVDSSKLRGHYLLLSPKVGGAHLVIIFT